MSVCARMHIRTKNKNMSTQKLVHIYKSQKNGWQEISLETSGKAQKKEIMVTCINVMGMEMEKMGRTTEKITK